MHPMRATRKAAGLTLAELSQATGIDTATLSRFERKDRDPKASHLSCIALALNCTIDDLIEKQTDAHIQTTAPALYHQAQQTRATAKQVRRISQILCQESEEVKALTVRLLLEIVQTIQAETWSGQSPPVDINHDTTPPAARRLSCPDPSPASTSAAS